VDNVDNVDNVGQFECKVCLELKSMEALSWADLPCGHQICRECATHWVKTEVTANNKVPRCPGPECDGEIEQQMLYLVMDEVTWKHYQLLCIKTGLQSETAHQCPLPDCDFVAIVDEHMTRFICNRCHNTSCAKCKVYPFHEGLTCEQYQRANTKPDENDMKLHELANQQGWKPCPHCGVMSDKIYGCFHITCSNAACGQHWCWGCGSKLNSGLWQAHFQGGGCQLWATDGDLLHDQFDE